MSSYKDLKVLLTFGIKHLEFDKARHIMLGTQLPKHIQKNMFVYGHVRQALFTKAVVIILPYLEVHFNMSHLYMWMFN